MISDKSSLPADVLWGSFVSRIHFSLRGGEMMRDKPTPKDVWGEAMT